VEQSINWRSQIERCISFPVCCMINFLSEFVDDMILIAMLEQYTDMMRWLIVDALLKTIVS
jgi:hypothetical protein